uniref:Glycosyl transferase group 1 n=1 Tax=Cyanothece sp. (strain PCC 7425 / ATCC 29141) TaxID=395961 RepID=B8HV89_CYAP4
MAIANSRIAFFLRFLGGGGAERVVLNLSKGFLAHGFKVDLLLSNGDSPHLWQVPKGVRVVDFRDPRVSSSLKSLIHYLREERPMALLPSLHYPSEIAILAKYLSRTSTRVIVTEHNNLSREIRCESSLFRKAIPLVTSILYPWADGIVAVSEGVAIDLAKFTGISLNRINVIYNPVVTPELIEKSKEPVDHPWFEPGAPPVILGVGKLEAQKDFPNLIRAFSHVIKVQPSRLMILGWGPDRNKLEALVRELGLENTIAFPGHVDNPYKYMAQSSVFVLSSAWEGLPTVLIEAMALGVPVVSTNCESGPSEILANGQYGYLTPVSNSGALAEAILQVLSGKPKPVDASWLKQFRLEAATQEYLRVLGIQSPTVISQS